MPRSSRKRVSRRRRVSSRTRRTRSRRVPRSLGTMSDTYHFKETVNAGTLFYPAAGGIVNATSGGIFIMRMTDFPAYTLLGAAFEFARINKCTIEFWPKANMQFNVGILTAAGTSGGSQESTSGTLITAIDQVPIVSTSGSFSNAATWANDSSNDTSVTSAVAVACSTLTPSYVRGLQNSREKELWKKHRISFYPAFYDYVVSNPTNVGTPASQTIDNGIYERKIKKWINCRTLEQSSALNPNSGPAFYGPVYALDVNSPVGDPSGVYNIELFDIRMTYSMSFKRLRGL